MKLQEIQIAFKIIIEGTQFRNEVSFNGTTPAFKNIKLRNLSASEKLYEILINKRVISTLPDQLKLIFREATQEAQYFIYVFSKAADIKIFNFEAIGYYDQHAEFFKIETVFPNMSGVKLTARFIISAGSPTIKKIKQEMKREYDIAMLQQYYDACIITEPIARFISLYTILLHNLGDDQKGVDQELLRLDPTIIQTKRPGHPSKYETVFTRLRNEMSHKREGVYLIDTHADIRQQVDRFEALVKQIIFKDA